MSELFSRLWREPLLHFLLIGAALFLYYGVVAEDGGEAPQKRIIVTSGQITQLSANFARSRMRQPTQQELDLMVENHVREEIFYREAMAMGLDQDDPMVRRRMRMKLEFMLEDLSGQDASDEVLTAFLNQHPERFRDEAQVTFRQVFLNSELRKNIEGSARQLLSTLNDGGDPDALGDPTMASRAFEMAPQSVVSRDFGDDFARELFSLPSGGWTGPLYSPFGAHLVRIDARTNARVPELAEIRSEVLREYLVDKREQQKNLAYQRLREGYEVEIEALNTEKTGVLSQALGETR